LTGSVTRITISFLMAMSMVAQMPWALYHSPSFLMTRVCCRIWEILRAGGVRLMGRLGWEGRRCKFVVVLERGCALFGLYSILLDTVYHCISLHFLSYHFVKDQSSLSDMSYEC
jgi:hypothetical protein